MKQTILIILGLFCYQHLLRDFLQEKGIKNWYTTFAHPNFIPDTPLNNLIGMVFFFCIGTLFLYLALR